MREGKREGGEGKGGGEYKGTGWLTLGKNRESKERDILIVGAIMGLMRNLAPGKFLGIHKDDPS